MKVIPASFEIQDDLDRQPLAERIEACGRICYKSEGKIGVNTAGPFIKNILKNGHNSVAEMGVVTLRVEFDAESLVHKFMATQPKFMQIDRPGKGEMLITGSIRSYRELFREYPSDKLIKAMVGYLGNRLSLFFEDIIPRHGWMPQTGVNVKKMSLGEVDRFPAQLLAKHRFVAIKFVVNRVVTRDIMSCRPSVFLVANHNDFLCSDTFTEHNELIFVLPRDFESGNLQYGVIEKYLCNTEKYFEEILGGNSTNELNGMYSNILPCVIKDEIILFLNLMEWGFVISALRDKKFCQYLDIDLIVNQLSNRFTFCEHQSR